MEIQESGLSAQHWTDKRLDCFVAHSVEARWRDDIVQVCKQVLPEFGLEPQFAADYYDPITANTQESDRFNRPLTLRYL